MKRAAKWVGVWILWVLVATVLFILIESITINWCSQYYPTVVAERKELYVQVDQIKNNFEEVYNMRNAQIVNSEETVVIISSEKFTLDVTFDKNRENIIAIEEKRIIPPKVWIVTMLVTVTALYVSYSFGKLNINLHTGKTKSSKNHQN